MSTSSPFSPEEQKENLLQLQLEAIQEEINALQEQLKEAAHSNASLDVIQRLEDEIQKLIKASRSI